MKITCSACGSKYTIADAKVQGKKVKVRCKSCKESIVVDGTQVAPGGNDEDEDLDADAPASVPPAAGNPGKGKDVWSVNLTDDDSREMTLDELVAAWKSGVVTSDAYVWKDGMSDWKPILEVGELKLKLGAAPAKGVVSSAGKGLPKAKANDLFGALEAAPAMGAPAKGQGSPKPAEAKPTGARNDSSVLFSLDSLGSPSDGGGSVSANIFGDLSVAAPTLTNETDLLMAPPKAPPPAPVGARTAMSMPMAPAKKGKSGLLVGGIAAGLLLLGGAVFALSGGDEDKAKADTQAADAAAEQAKAALEAERKKMQEERDKMKADLEKAQKEAAEAEQKKAEEAKQAAGSEKEPEQKPSEEKAAEDSKKPADASSPSPSPAPAAAPKVGPFSVAAAKTALSSAAAQAASCGKPGGPTGSGKVQVTFSTSGRVTSANVVSGPFGGTSVGGCVASTFRRARVPAFSGSPTTVAKSFTIR